MEQIKIVSVLPEGTRLTKGQEVLRFDTDKLQRTLAEQQIKVKQAEGKAEAARQELEVQRNKGEGEIAKADLTLTLAELDLEKYVKGDYKVELEEKLGGIKMAEKDLRNAEEKLKHYITLVRKGFETPDRLRQMELEVEKSRNNLERDKAKLMVLETYTLKRQQAEFSGKAADAKRELARTRASTAAVLAKAKADLEAAEGVAKLEKDQLKRDQEKLKLAVVRAPENGILVYAQTRGYWDPNSRIQAGGMVSFQQHLFKLPDLNQMQVKVRVHESKVKKIKVGQKAEIRVNAYPNQVLHGTVKTVATLADSEGI